MTHRVRAGLVGALFFAAFMAPLGAWLGVRAARDPAGVADVVRSASA